MGSKILREAILISKVLSGVNLNSIKRVSVHTAVVLIQKKWVITGDVIMTLARF